MQAITKFYGKRKRVSNIVKKYQSKKAKPIPYVPKSWFEAKTHIIGAGVAPGGAGAVISLVNIDGGSGRDQRTGNRVTFNNIEMRATARSNAAGANQNQLIRMLIVKDLQTVNSTIPSVSQILQSDVRSGFSLNDRGRFQVMFDKSFQLSQTSQTSEFLYYKLPVTCTTEWVANTGPQHSKNAIFCLFISDLTTNGPSLDYNIRMNYMDW